VKRAAFRAPAAARSEALQTHRRKQSDSSKIKAEIAALKEKIERGLIELHAEADRLMAKDK
jgi:hypothetical protein